MSTDCSRLFLFNISTDCRRLFLVPYLLGLSNWILCKNLWCFCSVNLQCLPAFCWSFLVLLNVWCVVCVCHICAWMCGVRCLCQCLNESPIRFSSLCFCILSHLRKGNVLHQVFTIALLTYNSPLPSLSLLSFLVSKPLTTYPRILLNRNQLHG